MPADMYLVTRLNGPTTCDQCHKELNPVAALVALCQDGHMLCTSCVRENHKRTVRGMA